MRLLGGTVLLLGIAMACGPAEAMPAPEPAPPPMPCDPGFGDPERVPTCPDPHPLVGEVTAYDGDSVTVQPLHVYWGDEGRGYAEAHGLEFSNDYVQVPEGPPITVGLQERTVCTAAIRVHTGRAYFDDHVVPCRLYGPAVRRYPVTSALWFRDGELLQLSELYRP